MYLSIPQISKHDPKNPCYEKCNPLSWWNKHKSALSLLAEQAWFFLGMPAISVPSEHLFSNTGNTLINKHNSLKTDTVHDLLF